MQSKTLVSLPPAQLANAPGIATSESTTPPLAAPHQQMVDLLRQLIHDPADPEKSEHAFWAMINSIVACYAAPETRPARRAMLEQAWLRSQTVLLVRNLDTIALMIDVAPRTRQEPPASYARRIAEALAEHLRDGDGEERLCAGRGTLIH